MTTGDASLDLGVLREWIGRTESAKDVLSPRLEASFRAMFDRPPGQPAPGDIASPLIHWCLTPPIAAMAAIGPDGHPRRGGFLPPVALPRRMWAGGALAFDDPLRVGDAVTRHSRVDDVALKTGRSGTLCFVTVRHEVWTARGRAIEERQDIVFRDAAGSTPAQAPGGTEASARWRRPLVTDPVLLFRYSALTFNGHRIHYDPPYATEVEGYPGLVVHGPLQATALAALAIEARGSVPRRFSFRGVAPLIVSRPAVTEAWEEAEGLTLRVADEAGRTTMQAEARW